MAGFEDLQHLWQQQAPRGLPACDAAELSDAFRRYGRRHDEIYRGKSILVGFQLVFFLVMLRHHLLALAGAYVAEFGGILFLLSDWRAQRAIARLDFASPSVEFVRTALARLNAQRDPFRTREFYIQTGCVWLGLGLVFAGFWPEMTLSQSLLLLAFYIALPFAAYASARRIRRKCFEKQCRPLIVRLESVLETMQADRI